MKLLVPFATIALAVVPACSKAPTTPSPIPGFSGGANGGAWAGQLSDTANGRGMLRLAVEEAPIGNGRSVLGGTWSATFDDATANASGTLSGGVAGTEAQLTLRRSTPLICPNPGPVTSAYGSFFAPTLVIGGNAITGPYDYIACGGTAAGRLDLRRP
jgi:hypothetical protein